jgi:tRNA nucleotidyltransferase (CCA-adding enzyme)
MKELGIPPSPRVGQILNELFERVTEDPTLNTREHLLELVREIGGTN